MSNSNFQCFIFLSILSFSIGSISAQKIKEVKNIIGTAFISNDISPNQAKAQALNDAKLNALKAAGIAEHINSYQLLFSSQMKNDYTQFFNSDIQSEMQGAVKSYNITQERVYCKSDYEIISELTLDAEVIKYDTKPDVSFDANVEGIKAVYNNDEKLRFSTRTTQPCYLTIFNITDKEAFVLYPNAYEKQKQLKALESYQFPLAKIDYTLHTDMKHQETNRLIFVFTKTEIPFIKMDKQQVTTHEAIFSWIYTIFPDQRKVEYVTLLILK